MLDGKENFCFETTKITYRKPVSSCSVYIPGPHVNLFRGRKLFFLTFICTEEK